MRPHGKARRPRILGIFERGATSPGGMQRGPNATRLTGRDTSWSSRHRKPQTRRRLRDTETQRIFWILREEIFCVSEPLRLPLGVALTASRRRRPFCEVPGAHAGFADAIELVHRP